MGNRDLILAGIKGGGTGASLAMFAPLGTALPTAATGAGSTLDPAFYDMGWCSEDGLKKAVSESVTTIRAFGTISPVRKLITSSETTFQLTALESNTTVIEVYNRKDLGSISVDGTGAFSVTEGEPGTVQMAAVFDLVDGPNRIRGVAPIVEVTDRGDFEWKAGSTVQYPITLTAYPGSDNVAIEWFYVIPALGS